MKIARREYRPLYIVLAATQLFCYMFLLRPLLISSGWLPVGLALAVALLPIMCARGMLGAGITLECAFERALGRPGARIWFALAAALVLMGAKAAVQLLSATVLTYTADPSFSRSAMAVTLIVAGMVACMGELALANCARITLGLMLAIIGAMALGALSNAHVEHFFPLLGPGPAEIGRSILPLAGMLVMPMLYLLRADACDPGMKRTLPVSAALAALTAALWLAIYTLSQPTLAAMSDSMSMRVAMLLNNGTGGVQLQLPIIVLWNACMLLLIAAQLAIGGSLLRMALPRLGRVARIAFILAGGALCLLRPSSRLTIAILEWAAYPVIAAGFGAAGILFSLRARKGRRETQ